ncbi:MAG TPA: hypothetical protein VHA33_09950, partial [Candidatus Angelobacter sp.]|nr:hypothetical protein [Candidatus Angelobacter sp.]
DVLPVTPQETDKKERQSYCLGRCLEQLSESDRDLITNYYQVRGRSNTEARKRLIAEHGGQNTLRVKAFRIRLKLRACIDSCMDETTK